MIFLDTNILLYAVHHTQAELPKRDISRTLLRRNDIALSMQVLQEFFHQATRPSRPKPLPDTIASELITGWLHFPVQVIGISEMKTAIAVRQRYQLSYWDSAIIAAALALGCDTLMSEDMQAGMTIEGMRIENPFIGITYS